MYNFKLHLDIYNITQNINYEDFQYYLRKCDLY